MTPPLRALHLPDEGEFRDAIAGGGPVHVTGGLAEWPAMEKWSRDYLRATPLKSGVTLGMFHAPDARQWLRPLDGAFALDEIIDRVWAARPADPYPDGSVFYMKQQPILNFPQLLKDVRRPLFYPDNINEVNVWIGGQGAWSPLHFDMADNVMCQVVGTRRVWLYSPQQSRDLYPVFAIGALDNPDVPGHFSMLGDVRAADTTRFPRSRGVTPAAAIDLGPGEMLYVPPYWWHHVEIVRGPAILVNFWYASQFGGPLTRDEQQTELRLLQELRGLFERADEPRRQALTGMFEALCQLAGRPRP